MDRYWRVTQEPFVKEIKLMSVHMRTLEKPKIHVRTNVETRRFCTGAEPYAEASMM